MKTGWNSRTTGKDFSRRDQYCSIAAVLIMAGTMLTGYRPLLAQNQPLPPPASPPSTATWPLLQLGETGDAVTQLQAELNRIGIYQAPMDGVYGADTEQAVKQFQRQQGLRADGVVGVQTWQALALAQSPAIQFKTQSGEGAIPLSFTPLTFSQPPHPPSPLWLALMPLVPLIGGALTYLQRRLQGRHPIPAPTSTKKPGRRKRNTRLPMWILALGLGCSSLIVP